MTTFERNEQLYEVGVEYARDVQRSGVPFGEYMSDGTIAMDPREAMRMRDEADRLRNSTLDNGKRRYFSGQYDAWDGYASCWD